MSGYAKQKFFEAVYSLVGEGSLQMRLTYAANELRTVSVESLPKGMRIEFTALLRELTSKPLSNDAGFIPRVLDRDESNRLSQTILRMYSEL